MLEVFAVHMTVLFVTWVTVFLLAIFVDSIVYTFADYVINRNKLLSIVNQISLFGVALYTPVTNLDLVTFKWLFAQNLKTLLVIIALGSAVTLMFRLTLEASRNRY